MSRRFIFTAACLFLSSQFALAVSQSQVAEDLCSPQGIAKLVPQMRGANGQLHIPDPKKHLAKFLQAYSALKTVINVVLTQAQAKANPYTVAHQKFERLRFGKKWWAAEVGFESHDGKVPVYHKGQFGDYGDASFMNGIIPVKGTGGSFYAVPGQGVFISPMPTILKCVNLVMETSGHDSGTFISPSYALGDKNGKAFLLVNGCQNTANSVKIKGKYALLSPGGSSYLGIQISNSVPK